MTGLFRRLCDRITNWRLRRAQNSLEQFYADLGRELERTLDLDVSDEDVTPAELAKRARKLFGEHRGTL